MKHSGSTVDLSDHHDDDTHYFLYKRIFSISSLQIFIPGNVIKNRERNTTTGLGDTLNKVKKLERNLPLCTFGVVSGDRLRGTP